ncbi:MAG: hypothetical protein LBD93_00655, partial [Treponema sp.]|nr:hypothetical protein [Treponema sp.]
MTDRGIFINQANTFLCTFRQFNDLKVKNLDAYSTLEKTIDKFSSFVLCDMQERIWNSIEGSYDTTLTKLVEELREQSAFCVWSLEKYRAIKLQRDTQSRAEYFKNIETCIETEFGSFKITSDSKVMMIGSGAFPMTPLLIS